MAHWGGFNAEYRPQSSDLRDVCFKHFDKDRDGVLNEEEFHQLCCDLFTVDGRDNVVTRDESVAMMKFLSSGEKRGIKEDDFEICWKNWLNQILCPRAALFVVDVQNDFVDGTLCLKACPARQDGAEVIPVINKLIDLRFDVVVYTIDHHPANHLSFYENLSLRKLHPSSKVKAEEAMLGDTVIFDNLPLVEQILWPVHCVQGTEGAKLHADLKIAEDHLIHPKGTDPDAESYSVFKDEIQRMNTALVADLAKRDITDIYICGLAYDFCVGKTALDAQSLGYQTMVIEDATRGSDVEKIGQMKKALLEAGCIVGRAHEVPAMVCKRTRHPQWGLIAARNAVQARRKLSGHHAEVWKGNTDQNTDQNLNNNLASHKGDAKCTAH